MSVSAVLSSPPTPSPGATPVEADTPTRAGRVLTLLRKLIDYGKDLAASLRQRTETTDLAPIIRAFSTRDIARILDRITCGLLRAQALRHKVVQNTARLDADPQPTRPTAAPRDPGAHRQPRDQQLGSDHAPLILPTPQQIAEKVRHQSIGAAIADICRDLGILPNHPLWRELQELIMEHGGNYARLVIETLNRPWRVLTDNPPTAAPTNPLAAACATGPP